MANHLSFFFSQKNIRYIGVIFMFNSFMFGNWVTRIPSMKESIGLNDAELGLALLGAPIGALCIMPISGLIIQKFQLGTTIWVSTLAHALAIPFLTISPHFWGLFIGLFFFGVTNAIMDVSMNSGAATVERQAGRPIMSTCHGMWSVGAMLGSALGSVLLGLEWQPLWHLSAVVLLVLLILAIMIPGLSVLKVEINLKDKVLAWPNLPLVLLALMAFFVLIGEGGIADWSAVYMRETLAADSFLTGLAYAGFSMTMAIGRLSGDAILPRFGKKQLVLWGGFIAAVGTALAISFPHPWVAIIGFSLAGFGFSCIVPIIFISAANEPGYAAGSGIAAVTTIGYSGFLIGPPFIGFLSESFGLNIGIGMIVLCTLLVSLLAAVVKFK